MLFNYLILTLRNLKKDKGYAIVNTLGLATGLAAAMFIFLYVNDELTFDIQHPKPDQTYRIGYRIEHPNGEHEGYPASPAGWDNYIKDNYPGVEAVTSFTTTGMPTSVAYEPTNQIILTEDIIWAESNYNKVLYLPLIKGNPANALNDVNSMVISESAAKALFGTEEPLGKTITISHQWMTNGKKVPMIINGVYTDFPSNTHHRPSYICNILSLREFTPNLEALLNTAMGDGENGFWTQSFIVLNDPAALTAILDDLQKKANAIVEKYKLDFKLLPHVRKITDVHFDQTIDWSITHKAVDRRYSKVFITIALLILLVASINYINLATAKSVARAREIGLRKTFGGVRKQLFMQFMSESFCIVALSAIIAVLAILLLLPQFNQLTGKTLTFYSLLNPTMLSVLGGTVLLVTLLSGSYPALFVSGFQPVTVLKGKFAFGKSSINFRQFLTTVQFIVAVILLTGSVIVVRQMDLMRNSKLNEAGNQIVSLRYGGFTGVANDQKFLAFKHELLRDPEIEAVTLANHLPRLDFFGPINMTMQFPEISEEKHEWFQLNGDYDFPRTFKIKFLAGRDFDPKNVSDSTAIILNESAAKALHLTPEELVGKSVIRPEYVMNYGPPDSTRLPITGTVIGVIEDFPYKSMHNKIDPLAICPKPHTMDRVIHVRVPASKAGEKIAYIEKTWKEVFPDFGFDYWFIDEEFGRMYENENQVAQLTEKFSALAILITCVGLYGLAAFLSEQRTKEIGIRKSLGASNAQILLLLLGVFAKVMAIGCFLGIPVAYYLANQWLTGFVYHTPLNLMLFGGVILLIGAITLVSVGYESLKASVANPVMALRHQ